MWMGVINIGLPLL